MPSPPRPQQALAPFIVISSDEDASGSGSSAGNSPAQQQIRRAAPQQQIQRAASSARNTTSGGSPRQRTTNPPAPSTGSPGSNNSKIQGYHGEHERRAVLLGAPKGPAGEKYPGVVVATICSDDEFDIQVHQMTAAGTQVFYKDWFKNPSINDNDRRTNDFGPVEAIDFGCIDLLPFWRTMADTAELINTVGNILEATGPVNGSEHLIMINARYRYRQNV